MLEGVVEIGHSVEGPEIADPQERRSRCVAALRETMERLARRRRVVLFLDDLQWVDTETVALLRSLMREPGPPLLLVMTSRPSAGSQLAILLAEWGPRCARIVLGPLSSTESIEVVQSRAGRPVDAETVSDADGSPFLLEELGAWLHAGAQGRVAVRQLLVHRLSELTERQQALLRAVSLAGQPLSAEELCALVDATRDQVLRDAAALTAARVTRAAAGDEIAFEPYHDRIREAAVDGLSGQARTELHRRLALCLAAADPVPHGACARHHAAAGNRVEAARHAKAAGHAANTEFAFGLAAEWFRFALDHIDSTEPSRGELMVDWAGALANAADGWAAAEAYLEAAHVVQGRLRAIELRRRAAEEFLRIGELDRGTDVLREVLAAQGMKFPKSMRAAIVETVAHRALVRLRGHKFATRHERQIDPEMLTKIDTCWTVASALGFVDPGPSIRYQVKHLALALDAGEPYRLARALAMEVGHRGLNGSSAALTPSMMHCLQRAYELADAANRPHARGIAHLFESAGASFRGCWLQSKQCAERAYTVFAEQCTGVSWEIAGSQMYLLVSAFFAGDLQTMCERMPAWQRAARERRDLFQRTVLQSGFPSFYWLVVDRPDRAREFVAEAMQPWSRRGFHLQHYFALWAQGHIDQYEGRARDAFARWQTHWRSLEQAKLKYVQLTRISGHDARARCALAAALDGDASAAAVAKADARTIEKERMPWGNALAFMLRASLAALDGARDRAARMLSQAATACGAADMSMHKTCCEYRLARLHGDEAGANAAHDWLANQGIVQPDKIADVILPWPKI